MEPGSSNPADDPDPDDCPGQWWYQNRQRKIRIDDAQVSSFIDRVVKDLTPGFEGAVVIAGDDAVRQANRNFRGKAESTDVLSFPDEEPGRLGDILISAARAAEQAQDFSHSVEDELKTLILHGMLHLLGLDHETDSGEMAIEEARLRKRYGLPSGLIERVQC